MGGGPEEPPPRIIDVEVRRLHLDSDEDKKLCEAFACGDAEWELTVSGFITRKIWLPGRTPEYTLLGVEVESRRLFGFGAWKYTTVELPQREDPVEVIRVCYFGVADEFKGAVDEDGRRWASRLYTTLEEDARAQPRSTPEMPLELYCDRRNERGIRFWTGGRRGFVEIGPGPLELVRFVRTPPTASDA